MNHRLRVLMTADTVGGVWSYALDLAQALDGRVEFVVATLGAPLRADQRAAADRAGLEVVASSYKLEWMDDPWDDVEASSQWLLELEGAYQPDLIHLNTYAHGALPWTSPVVLVGHSCVLSWWRAVHGVDAPESWNLYRRYVAQGLRSANVVAAPTRAMLDCLERCHAPLPHARVIHNATAPAASDPSLKQPYIFTAGRVWDRAKNIEALCAAAEYLAWPVYVAGDTQSPDGAEGRYPAVRLLGPQPQPRVHEWMARASIYALPARYEPFGLSILEAAHRHCALVVGDIASLREVWGDAALYVPPDDARALRTALHALIMDEPLRAAMAAKAHARAQHYQPEVMAREYLDVYAELLGAPRPCFGAVSWKRGFT
jgi:glycogen synthase